MTAFDAHAHVIVPELLRGAEPGGAWRPTVRVIAGHLVVELGDGRSSAEAALLHASPERELRRVPPAGGPRG